MLAELRNIRRSYGQGETASWVLDDISLNIGVNESVAIVGPSGSGKSTLLNILGTLDRPTSGTVLLDGRNISELDGKELSVLRNQFVGFVFQLHHLLPQLTLLENVTLPLIPLKDGNLRKEGTHRALQLLERMGLGNHMHRRPGQLSVGECQRAALVRALVNKPRLLLADEPTGSLDARNAVQVAELITGLQKEENLAMVVVTHSMELASRMQTIYRLTSGKLHPVRET